MRTSLNKVAQAENFLSGNLLPEEMLIFSASIQLDAVLKTDVQAQEKTYSLIRLYGREKLKAEIEEIHRTLFTNPKKASFRLKIYNLFIKF